MPGAGPILGGLRVPQILYADDVVLLVETPGEMQQLLDVLQQFCTLFGMQVNLTKTKGVVFHSGDRAAALRGCTWRFNGQRVGIVQQYTYLGVVFHEKHGCSAGVKARAAAGRGAMLALLGRARVLHLDQSDLLCRLFDHLVEPVLSFGCQVWGSTVAEAALRPPRSGAAPHALYGVLDRVKVAAEGVHLDFLRRLGGLPTCSHRWITLAEFGRRPLLLRWAKLLARYWERLQQACCTDVDPGDISASPLVIAAFKANIQLYLDDRNCACWAGELLRVMHALGVIVDPATCVTVDDVLGLSLTEQSAVARCDALVESWWQQHGASHADPRSASEADVCLSTYRRGVQGGVVPPKGAPHLKSHLLPLQRQALIRFRVGSYPLRIATGRNEGDGSANAQPGQALGSRRIARSMRTCRVCGVAGAVEDMQHFLLECPFYDRIRQSWGAAFGQQATTASVLGQRDQCRLAATVSRMLEQREQFFQGGDE